MSLIQHEREVKKESAQAQIPPIDDHNLLTPAIKLSQQIKQGYVTSEEVVESFISRIKLVNPIINAVVERRFDAALREARDIDRRLADARQSENPACKSILKLPLVGVPVSIKETIALDGYSYTGGLVGRRHVKAPKTADAVQLLLKQGLIPIAMTNIPELAMWWDASNPVYGQTNNPYDLSRIPGGSSGGEAALISAAGSVVGLGSDLAGSIRIPANFCGIFGHKPTPHIVPNEGMYPTVRGEREKLFGVGPLARYACDLLPMLKALAAPSKLIHLQLDEPVDLKTLKIYYIDELGDPLASKCGVDILSAMHAAIGKLTSKHKIVAERVYFEEFEHGFFLWSAEANVDTDATQFGTDSASMNPLLELAKGMFSDSDHNMGSILTSSLDTLGRHSSHDSKANKSLLETCAELRHKFNELLGPNGLLFVPTHPETAPEHHSTFMKVFNVSYTSVTTVLRAPVTQVPLGLSKEGLPFGVQILARPHNDRLTLAAALELEKLNGGWQAPCRIDV